MPTALLALALAAAAAPVPLHEGQARITRALAAALPSFPGLAGKTVVLRPYQADDLYFRAWVEGWWGSRERRTYAVMYNLELLKDFPPQDALVAILAHELAHLEQFAALGRWELLRLALPYALSDKREAAHERATDMIAMQRGFAPGLLAYKRWILERSDDREKARRRRVYLTPEEVEAWIREEGARHLKTSN